MTITLQCRRSFDQALAIEWSRAERTKKPVSLLLADVDHFKLYNDLHGHQKGDECLRAIAAVLGDNAKRPADLPARYGGEEFAVICRKPTKMEFMASPHGCGRPWRVFDWFTAPRTPARS